VKKIDFKSLCTDLIEADSENDVIGLLKSCDYWDDPRVWRFYGDYENNYNVIGNQQSRPDSALVEKLVNSVDARLMNECLVRRIDPEGSDAPKTIRQAVAQFFEDSPDSTIAGLVSEWPKTKRTDVARQITLSSTGMKPSAGNPCLTISDSGEGQTPLKMPETLLSLNKNNKLRVPFVQGKFNMGGTGVLKFCGSHKLQLIVSRRNPIIAKSEARQPSDWDWGFTIVRREDPSGGVRSSVYKYLAPIDSKSRPGFGGVLHFSADEMPIFPEADKAYVAPSSWGTLIKLFEYSIPNKSNILMPDGLLSRVDLLLPLSALPMRFHECRDYRGHKGSYETTVLGLNVRLGDASRDEKRESIEDSFPTSCKLTVMGEKMTATIYAFKKDKGKAYRKNEGVIFSVNGQTHGHLTTDFFRRKKTGCSYLRDSLLVIVDCSELSGRAREDLFMNSRDRLSSGELRRAIEGELETILKESKLLRKLREKRQREQRDTIIEESKPLENVLQSILEKNKTLSKLFLEGIRISAPFKTTMVEEEDVPYEGKKHPTYFKFKNKDYGTLMNRSCHINMRARIAFETDVANDYFDREIDKGTFTFIIIDGDEKEYADEPWTLNMENGIANLNISLPKTCEVGDSLKFKAIVDDRTLLAPFINIFSLTILKEAIIKKSKPTSRKKPSGDKPGSDRETASKIEPPRPTKVYQKPKEGQKGWADMEPPFEQYTALRIRHALESEESEDGKEIYDFYINMDNIYLVNEQKSSKREADVLEACFLYGMVLVGIALVHEDLEFEAKKDEKGNDDEDECKINVEDKVESFTKAIAPILLPMIENLGSFEHEYDSVDSVSGEAE